MCVRFAIICNNLHPFAVRSRIQTLACSRHVQLQSRTCSNWVYLVAINFGLQKAQNTQVQSCKVFNFVVLVITEVCELRTNSYCDSFVHYVVFLCSSTLLLCFVIIFSKEMRYSNLLICSGCW